MRRLISTLLLVGVLAGLGGYIYFVDMKRPASDFEAKPVTFDVAAADIEEIQITITDGDHTRAQRADGAWKLVEPMEADGDGSELTNMASSLAALDVQRVVDEAPTDLTQYGLSPARLEIAFRARGQEGLTRLLVGDRTPTGGEIYAKKPDEARVFLVSSLVDDTFNRSAFDLRDKTVLKFDRDKVDGLEITRGAATLRFARKGADWTIVAPGTMRADYAAIEGLITSMSATLAHKYVNQDVTTAELRQYGLDRPTTSASILMGDDRATILLGRTDNAETYAKNAANDTVVMVAPTIVSDLAKPLDDFRRKDLFDMRSFSATHLEVTRDGETLVLDKSTADDGTESWKSVSGAEVETAKVEDALTQLSNLRATSFEARVDPALNTPALQVVVRFGQNKDENRTETVRLARTGSALVASRPDEPGAIELEAFTFDAVLTALDALK